MLSLQTYLIDLNIFDSSSDLTDDESENSQLLSSKLLNEQIHYLIFSTCSGWAAHTPTVVYEKCNCGTSRQCTQSSRGMMVGCYALESLLQLTLQCFYDQDCIDSNQTFTKLDTTSLTISRFGLNTTIESIVNNVMVEKYASHLSYESYFDEHDATEATLSLISLYGGLAILTTNQSRNY
jgi:hypothetical protein